MTRDRGGASLTAAKTDPACGIPPRAAHGVRPDSRSIFLARAKQFPSDQPTHRSLRGTLRQSNRLGQFLITHLNGSLPACLFGGEPNIDKEAGGSPIVTDQVTHQHVYNVIIEIQHGYTNHQYSNEWLIALTDSGRYAPDTLRRDLWSVE